MTWSLIGINTVLFLFEASLPEPLLERLLFWFGIVPARFYAHQGVYGPLPYIGDIIPFFSSMFLHGGWLHLIGNMWTLWIFGDNVEDELGPFRFLALYLVCGLLAGVMHLVTNASSTLPTIGASGAIAGIMGAYFVFFPGARIIFMIPIFFFPFFFELPAYFYLAFWLMEQVFSGTLSIAAGATGGIAWWAHVGGFVSGMFLVRLFSCRRGVRCRWLSSNEDYPWGMLPPGDRF